MASPARIFDYDMETRERILRKEQEVPSGRDPSRYVTRRIEGAGDRRLDRADLAALQPGNRTRRLRACLL
jgi:hypothetical protein